MFIFNFSPSKISAPNLQFFNTYLSLLFFSCFYSRRFPNAYAMSIKHSWLNTCFVFYFFAVITASFLIGLILFLVLALPLTNPSWYHSVYYQEQLQDGWWRTSRKGITTNTLRKSKLNSRWTNRLLVRKKLKVCFRPHLFLNSLWGTFGMCNKNFYLLF